MNERRTSCSAWIVGSTDIAGERPYTSTGIFIRRGVTHGHERMCCSDSTVFVFSKMYVWNTRFRFLWTHSRCHALCHHQDLEAFVRRLLCTLDNLVGETLLPVGTLHDLLRLQREATPHAADTPRLVFL